MIALAVHSQPAIGQQPTIGEALNQEFLDYTKNACKITDWVTVKQAKALSPTDKVNDKDKAEAPDVVPQAFKDPFSMQEPIATQIRDVTIAGVTEKVYTEGEVNDLTKFAKGDNLIVLDSAAATLSVSQVSYNHNLAYYSHSCNYLLSLGMSAKAGYSLPFASVQAALAAQRSPEATGNLVMIGGTFPTRLYVLLHDTLPNQLFAAASIWDWYTRQSPDLLSQKLYYLQSVRGFADSRKSGQQDHFSGTLNANGNLSFIGIASLGGSVQANVGSQEDIYSQSYTVTLLKSETAPVLLPDDDGLAAIFKVNPTKRPPNSTGQAKFDTNYHIDVVQQSEGLPAKVCNRTWQFVPGDGNQVKVKVDGVTAAAGGDASKPICTFSFGANLDQPLNFAGRSAKLVGAVQATDAKSNKKIALPVTALDIYLPDLPSPTQVTVTPFPQVDAWQPQVGGHNLQYGLTVPFDDKGNALDWSGSQSFTADRPTLTCQDKVARDVSWAPNNGLTVVPGSKTIKLLLGYSYFPAQQALDIYTGNWNNAPTCTVSFTLRAPQKASPDLLSFSIDSAKIGNGLPLYFPKPLSAPQIKVILPSGPATAADASSPVTLPDGFVSTPYNSQGSTVNLQVTGGLGPYSWEWTGDLPPQMDNPIKANDKYGAFVPITGTPAVAGRYVFTAQVTDKAGQVASQLVSMNVNSALTITTTQLAAAKVGENYKQSLAATGGTASYHWKLVSGPPAPQVSVADDGTVTFSPAAAGTTTIVVEVSDSWKPAHTQRASFDITITQ
jgi:uncharacterized protein affecting Mg2+/Co2+ transport